MSYNPLKCLQDTSVGFLRHLAPSLQGLMNPVSAGEPAHYISTLPLLGQDAQDPSPFLKKDVERFLWNFLAARTASGPAADGGAQDYLSLSFLSAVPTPRAQSL